MTIAWAFTDDGGCSLDLGDLGIYPNAIKYTFDNSLSDVDVVFTYIDYYGIFTSVHVNAGEADTRLYYDLGCAALPAVEISSTPGFPGPGPSVFETNDYDFTSCCDPDVIPTIEITTNCPCCAAHEINFDNGCSSPCCDVPLTWDTGQPLLVVLNGGAVCVSEVGG